MPHSYRAKQNADGTWTVTVTEHSVHLHYSGPSRHTNTLCYTTNRCPASPTAAWNEAKRKQREQQDAQRYYGMSQTEIRQQKSRDA